MDRYRGLLERYVEVYNAGKDRLAKELVVVDNLYYDNLAVAAQIGLLPQPATAS